MPKAKRSQLDVIASDTSSRDDKRVYCRFAVKDVPVRFKDLKIGEKGMGFCKDIGAGGAHVECAHEVRPKTPLEVWFDIADGFEPMHCLGKVAWAKLMGASWRLGIEFQKQKLMSLTRIMKMEQV